MSNIYDNSEYINLFVAEVEEQVEKLDNNIILLEQQSENKDVINTIFRIAHTLKGSSATMGFNSMKELTHAMEDVFDAIRNDRIEVNRDIIDLLLRCSDIIKVLKQDFTSGTLQNTDISEIVSQLKRYTIPKENVVDPTKELLQQAMKQNHINTVAVIQEKESEIENKEIKILDRKYIKSNFIKNINQDKKDMVEEIERKGLKPYCVIVKIPHTSEMKAVRSYLVEKNLSQVGEFITRFPDDKVLESKEFDDLIYCLLVTDASSSEIIRRLSVLTEIIVVSCEKLDDLFEQEIQHESEANKSTTDIKISHLIKVDTNILEQMMNLIGELVIEQTKLEQSNTILKNIYNKDSNFKNIDNVSKNINKIVKELQNYTVKTRMMPIATVFNKLPRMVRDIQYTLGKEINFTMEGEGTELDRNLIEEITDPIIHLIRNCIGHGIEAPLQRDEMGKPAKGNVQVSAEHAQSHIVITIKDDGKGIDPKEIKRIAIDKKLITPDEASLMSDGDLINLIFIPGFSTSTKVDEISGRGVGMDIVKNHVEKLSGLIDIETQVGKGTKFIIKLPLTLAIIPALIVNVIDKKLAIPLPNIIEVVRMTNDEITHINGKNMIAVRDKTMPLISLHKLFSDNESFNKKMFVIIVGFAEKRYAINVDSIKGTQGVVVKSLPKYIGKINGLSGATILGDGTVSFIIDIANIVKYLS